MVTPSEVVDMYNKPTRKAGFKVFGETQICDICKQICPTSEMNVPNRIPVMKQYHIIKPSELRGMMFVCDYCKDHIFIPIEREEEK